MRAIQSRPWPAVGATLEYAAVWGSRASVAAQIPRFADGVETHLITTMLEPAGKIDGVAVPLRENAGIAFEGCKPSGSGFVITVEEGVSWIEHDTRNEQVIFPYLNGEDLNTWPGVSPQRWIIDFYGRDEEGAARFREPYAHVRSTVRQQKLRGSASAQKGPWWQFERSRPAMRTAIANLNEVIAMSRHSVTVMPRRVATTNLFGDALVVFAKNSYEDLAVLSSSMHQLWAIKYGSGIRADPRYTSSKVFMTFPRPRLVDNLSSQGKTLEHERGEIMLRRDLGLTKLYNLVNAPDITDSADPDVARLRQIHVELDEAVMAAYGWFDVPLEHGFHTYRQMRRWTVSPAARVEILDRLLEENHRRAAAQGEAPPPAEAEDTEGEDE